MTIGIDYYDSPSGGGGLTLSEILASMSSAQKLAVLDGYASRPVTTPRKLKHRNKVPERVTGFLYAKIEAVETTCKRVMTGNYVITEAVLDESGEVVTPATYEEIPSGVTVLRTFTKSKNSSTATSNPDDFNDGQIDAIVNKLVTHSKKDGSGNWAFYAANVRM